MTDLERFVALYASLGITCIVNKADVGNGFCIFTGNFFGEGGTESEKFDGYPSMFSEIDFDKDGKFISQGFWE